MTEPGVDSARLRELLALALEKPPFQWDTALPKCSTLLSCLHGKLLDGSEPQTEQARMLKRVFEEVVEIAYKTAQAQEGDDGPNYVLASGALIGLITETPDGYKRPTAITTRKRSANKEARHELAGNWLQPPKVRKNTKERECHAAFIRAFDAFLADTELVKALTHRLGLRGSVTTGRHLNESPDGKVEHARGHIENESYVHRYAIEAHFAAAREDSRTKIIALVGLPGMGKTWLADELTVADRPHKCSWVAVDAGKPNSGHVGDMINRHGIQIQKNLDDPVERLVAALGSDQAPDVVVIDNLESLDELKTLLPKDTRSVIIATARKRGSTLIPRSTIIEVGEVTEAEAVDIARNRNPNVESVAAKKIAKRLDHYPLAINYVCVLQRETGIAISDLEPTRHLHLLKEIPLEAGGTLIAALERLVSLLKERDRQAYALLILLTGIEPYELNGYLYPDDSGRRHFVMERYIAVGTKSDPAVERLRCLQVLREFQFVSDVGTRSVIHPVVRPMLRRIASADIAEVVRRCVSVLANIDDYWTSSPHVSGEEKLFNTEKFEEHLYCLFGLDPRPPYDPIDPGLYDYIDQLSDLQQIDPRLRQLMEYFDRSYEPNFWAPNVLSNCWHSYAASKCTGKTYRSVPDGLRNPFQILQAYMEHQIDEQQLHHSLLHMPLWI